MTDGDAAVITEQLLEKERDLELAAKIGKSLLDQNKELRIRNEFLEDQLTIKFEEVTQLKHEIQNKTELLHIFTEDDEDASCSTTSVSDRTSSSSFYRKVQRLEEENAALKFEQLHLKSLSENLEAQESSVVSDCLLRLHDANQQVEQLSTELAKMAEECLLHQEELTALQAKQTSHQAKLRCFSDQNENLLAQLSATQEAQNELSQELLDLQHRYAEVLTMLDETKQELRELRKQKDPLTDYSTCSAENMSYESSLHESLASELVASDSSGYGGTELSSSNISPVASARYVLGAISPPREDRSAVPDVTNASLHEVPRALTPALSTSDGAPHGRGPSRGSEGFPTTGESDLGVPGTPGSKDLKAAMRRLQVRRDIEQLFSDFRNEKLLRHTLPCNGCRSCPLCQPRLTNNSVPASEPPAQFCTRSRNRPKVEIIKSLAGSLFLKNWSDLADTQLSDLFIDVPNVISKNQQLTCSNAPQAFSDRTSKCSSIDSDFISVAVPQEAISSETEMHSRNSVLPAPTSCSIITALATRIPEQARSNAFREWPSCSGGSSSTVGTAGAGTAPPLSSPSNVKSLPSFQTQDFTWPIKPNSLAVSKNANLAVDSNRNPNGSLTAAEVLPSGLSCWASLVYEPPSGILLRSQLGQRHE